VPTPSGHSSTRSDEELFRLAAAGDEAAFEALYDRRQGGVYRFALRMSGSPAVAEDVTQDVFVDLMRDAAKFDPARGSLAAYLYGMARHRVLRRIARDRAFVPIEGGEDADAAEELDASAPDPLAEIMRARTIEAVRAAVLALPVHYREVVVLCNLQEMNYAEAAEALGLAVGTVRSRLHRARELLVARLRAVADPEPSRTHMRGGLR
jgi:RNA polymerase sigma-70 factor (ECF subfamily)